MTVAAADVDASLARASASVSAEAITDLARLLVRTPSPPGRERALAETVAAWGRAADPALSWEIDALDEESASLVARSASGGGTRELAIYGHLDTSLTGTVERDLLITGADADQAPFRSDETERTLRGLGVGVAKAPAAAGTIAFLATAAALRELGVRHRLTLLLAAGGTHRAAPPIGHAGPIPFGRGVAKLLAAGWRPSAVLNVKGGPPGVLHEEPASAYLRVRIRRAWSAALQRRSAAPDGGIARHAGRVIDAVEGWRDAYLQAHSPTGQLGCEIALGALRAGLPEKADLIPGLLELFVYAVLPPESDPVGVAQELEAWVRSRCTDVTGAAAAEVDLYAFAPGGRGDPDSEIVRLARAAYAAHAGEVAAIRDWTGATDGGLFLAAGIPTARLGVRVSRDDADPRIEIVSVEDLVACARAYVDVTLRYLTGPAA